MLGDAGLTSMVVEPIYRERMPADDRPATLYPIEREGLMVIAAQIQDRKESGE